MRYQVALRRGKRFCDIWGHKVQQLHWSLLVFAFCSDGKSHGYSASFTNSWKPIHIRRHPYEQNVIKGTENVEGSFHTCTSCSIQHTLTQMKSFASCDSHIDCMARQASAQSALAAVQFFRDQVPPAQPVRRKWQNDAK